MSPSRVVVDDNGNNVLRKDHFYNYEVRNANTVHPPGTTIAEDGTVILPPIVKDPIYVDHLGRTLNNNLPVRHPSTQKLHGQVIQPPIQPLHKSPQRSNWGYKNPEE